MDVLLLNCSQKPTITKQFLEFLQKIFIFQDEFGNNLNGVAQLLLSKNREGGLSDVSLTFNPYCSSFKNIEPTWITDDLPTIHFNNIRKGEFDETNNNPF